MAVNNSRAEKQRRIIKNNEWSEIKFHKGSESFVSFALGGKQRDSGQEMEEHKKCLKRVKLTGKKVVKIAREFHELWAVNVLVDILQIIENLPTQHTKSLLSFREAQ